MFNCFKKDKKLYKFVYDEPYSANWNLHCGFTLLIAARNAAEAVEKFYKVVNRRVSNITEFTEIKYPEGEVKSNGK